MDLERGKKVFSIITQNIWGKFGTLVLKMTDGYDWNTFSSDEKTQHAVGMALINIGESVKLLNKELKKKNNTVRWNSIAGLRDVAAHGYQTLHMDDTWKNITEDVPELLESVKEILHAEDERVGNTI